MQQQVFNLVVQFTNGQFDFMNSKKYDKLREIVVGKLLIANCYESQANEIIKQFLAGKYFTKNMIGNFYKPQYLLDSSIGYLFSKSMSLKLL